MLPSFASLSIQEGESRLGRLWRSRSNALDLDTFNRFQHLTARLLREEGSRVGRYIASNDPPAEVETLKIVKSAVELFQKWMKDGGGGKDQGRDGALAESANAALDRLGAGLGHIAAYLPSPAGIGSSGIGAKMTVLADVSWVHWFAGVTMLVIAGAGYGATPPSSTEEQQAQFAAAFVCIVTAMLAGVMLQ